MFYTLLRMSGAARGFYANFFMHSDNLIMPWCYVFELTRSSKASNISSGRC